MVWWPFFSILSYQVVDNTNCAGQGLG
jgi:hypothetical protein